MTDITELMSTYRECSRNLWNVYYAKRDVPGCWIDTYEQIRKLLFDSLVVDHLSYEGTASVPNIPLPALRVVPRSEAKVMIAGSNSPRGSTAWQAPDLLVTAENVTLAFRDFFDWSSIMGTREFQYCLCTILQFSGHPEYEGCRALIESWDVRIFHDEEHDDDPHASKTED